MLPIILAIILMFSPVNFSIKNKSENNLLQKNFPISLGPELTAKSALVIDADTNKVIFKKEPNKILPIASLTKLMTTLVFLDNKNRKFSDLIKIKKDDISSFYYDPVILPPETLKNNAVDFSSKKIKKIKELPPSKIGLVPGETIKLKDIFYATLVKSANDAAEVLSRYVELPPGKNFVDLMNEKAKYLGMNQTHFVEPTGLNPSNHSTAQDLSKLVMEVVKREEIKQALDKSVYDIQILRPGGTKFYKRIRNTDKLLNSFINFIEAKTGYLDESGYCFAGEAQLNNRKFIIIILGSATSQDRFQEAKALTWWAANH